VSRTIPRLAWLFVLFLGAVSCTDPAPILKWDTTKQYGAIPFGTEEEVVRPSWLFRGAFPNGANVYSPGSSAWEKSQYYIFNSATLIAVMQTNDAVRSEIRYLREQHGAPVEVVIQEHGRTQVSRCWLGSITFACHGSVVNGREAFTVYSLEHGSFDLADKVLEAARSRSAN